MDELVDNNEDYGFINTENPESSTPVEDWNNLRTEVHTPRTSTYNYFDSFEAAGHPTITGLAKYQDSLYSQTQKYGKKFTDCSYLNSEACNIEDGGHRSGYKINADMYGTSIEKTRKNGTQYGRARQRNISYKDAVDGDIIVFGRSREKGRDTYDHVGKVITRMGPDGNIQKFIVESTNSFGGSKTKGNNVVVVPLQERIDDMRIKGKNTKDKYNAVYNIVSVYDKDKRAEIAAKNTNWYTHANEKAIADKQIETEQSNALLERDSSSASSTYVKQDYPERQIQPGALEGNGTMKLTSNNTRKLNGNGTRQLAVGGPVNIGAYGGLAGMAGDITGGYFAGQRAEDEARLNGSARGPELQAEGNIWGAGAQGALKGGAAGAMTGNPMVTGIAAAGMGAYAMFNQASENEGIRNANKGATSLYNANEAFSKNRNPLEDSSAFNVDIAAQGGQLNGMAMNNAGGAQTQLNEYIGGGTHEENPNGGIPVGSNGQPVVNSNQPVAALVEEGEVSFDFGKDKQGNKDVYAFSNRITATSGKNAKTFADEAKRIESKYKFREDDDISNRVKKEEFAKLREDQEIIKARKARIEEAVMARAVGEPSPLEQQAQPQGMPQQAQVPSQEGAPQMAKGGQFNPYGDPVNNFGSNYNPNIYGTGFDKKITSYDDWNAQQIAASYGQSGPLRVGGSPMMAATDYGVADQAVGPENTNPKPMVAADGYGKNDYDSYIKPSPQVSIEDQIRASGEAVVADRRNMSAAEYEALIAKERASSKAQAEARNKPYFANTMEDGAKAMLPGYAAQVGSAMYDYASATKNPVRFDRQYSDNVNYAEQRANATMNYATQGNTMRRMISDNGISTGSVNSNLAASSANLIRGMNKEIGSSWVNQNNTNVGINNKDAAANAMIQQREAMANYNDSRYVDEKKSSAIKSMGQATAGYGRDIYAYQKDREKANFLGTDKYGVMDFGNGSRPTFRDGKGNTYYYDDNNIKQMVRG